MSKELNKKFTDDPLSFMKKYSVLAPDTVAHNKGVTLREISSDNGKDYVFSSMHASKRIAYLNLEKTPRGVARSMGGGKGSGTVGIDGTFTPRPDAFKSFFLPWNAANGIVKLSIPPVATAVNDADVRYFFTAAINGCSIFVKGTPQSPEIYHAGGDTTHGNDPTKATEFWREMMLDYTGPNAISAEINKKDYISDPTTTTGYTDHINTFTKWVKSEAKGDLNIERVEPWGCVMGIRDLRGDWSFYLQENATIHHSKFKKVLFFNTKKTVKGSETSSARPMIFRKFFPGGLGNADFTPSMPRKL